MSHENKKNEERKKKLMYMLDVFRVVPARDSPRHQWLFLAGSHDFQH